MDGGDFLIVMCLRPNVSLMSLSHGSRHRASVEELGLRVMHVSANFPPSRAEIDLAMGVMVRVWGVQYLSRIRIGRSRRRRFDATIFRGNI